MTEISKATSLRWRNFLKSPEGIEGLLFLNEMVPGIQKDALAHNMVYDSGKAEGFRYALYVMKEMIGVQKQEEGSLEN